MKANNKVTAGATKDVVLTIVDKNMTIAILS